MEQQPQRPHNLTEYYESAQLYNHDGYEYNHSEKNSLFGVYLFGIITALVILSGAIAVVTLSPHRQREIITERVITVTSAANITPQSPAQGAEPTRLHKIPPKPASTRHVNKPPARINTTPPAPITTPHPNNCPTNVNVKDNIGYTPLHHAVSTGKVDETRLLLDCGANVNAKDNEGGTPLHEAASSNYVDVVRLLLDRGADVNSTNNYGFTPLYYAAGSGYVDVARLLLDRGADVNATIITTTGKWTPLREAAYFKRYDVVALLRSHGGHE